MDNLPKIEILPFPEDQYYKQAFDKKQIVLHHTASGRGSDGDYKHWLSNKERVSTSQIINQDGTCAQLFNSKWWGHHIGSTHANNLILNKESIAIEIDSWGGLTYDTKTREFKTYTGKVVPQNTVIEYDQSFRGYRFFERYTEAQIESVRKLLVYWSTQYKIPLTYNDGMWEVSQDALNKKPGIWTHVSYRKDKSDCHPQPELIAMLKRLC
ncbi:MAG: N-acetylmuramoyl-L-alanine amidase [Cytophagaceae bacterium]|nr:N-acetylmuramoyl-L-alanine amidase [Cytophagaceae bacterium]